jgi:hypothetical protein
LIRSLGSLSTNKVVGSHLSHHPSMFTSKHAKDQRLRRTFVVSPDELT